MLPVWSSRSLEGEVSRSPFHRERFKDRMEHIPAAANVEGPDMWLRYASQDRMLMVNLLRTRKTGY